MSRIIEVEEVMFKNLCRYGNTWQSLNFKTGLTNIYGKNGAGKSIAIEALHFNWYGLSYRGLNLSQLINDVNGEKLETYSVFYVTENKKRLIDERIKLLASLPHSISFSFGNELKAEICNSSS